MHQRAPYPGRGREDEIAQLRRERDYHRARADQYELACGILLRASGPFTTPPFKRRGPSGVTMYEWPRASVEKLQAAVRVAWQYMCQAEGAPVGERPAPIQVDADDLAERALEAAQADKGGGEPDDVDVDVEPLLGSHPPDIERGPEARDLGGLGARAAPPAPAPEPPVDLREFGITAEGLDALLADGLPWQIVCPVEGPGGKPCGATLFMLSRMAVEPGHIEATRDLFRTMRERHMRMHHPPQH